jgi:CRISPR-associated protein Cas1
MMTLPDFMEKQILFVRAEKECDNFLRFQNDNILYRRDGENMDMISCSKVFAIFITGDFSITTVLIRNCEQFGISLFLLKNNFQAYARVIARLDGNYLLREKQYSFMDEFRLAKNLVRNKSYNQLALLVEKRKIKALDGEYQEICRKIEQAGSEKELLGLEGSMSKYFFQEYFSEQDWRRRLPRAKYDVNNVLLDIGYTFLFNFVDALLNLYGFDTYKGFYHKLFFQRQSLSCDLVEPFRCLIDRQLLKANNLKQIDGKDFDVMGEKYVLTYAKQAKYLRLFMGSLMNWKEDIFQYVKGYYRFMMREGEEFPFFKIK